MAQCIRRSAKETSGISNGGGARKSRARWWDDEVKERVKGKQKAYAALNNSTSDEDKEVREAMYKAAKNLVKEVVTIEKNNAYERLY